MKIAVWYNLGGGGAKRALHQHVSGLVARGHHVEVFCPSTARTDFLPLSGLCTEHVDEVDGSAMAWRPGAAARVLEALRPRRGLDELDAHLARVAGRIAAGGFDVLFANTCQYNAVPSLAGRVDLPALLYLQEPRRSSYEASPVLPWVGLPGAEQGGRSVSRAVRELLLLRVVRAHARRETQAAHGYDRVLVNSFYSRESVMKALGVDPVVCYLGVDSDFFTPDSSSQRGHLLGVGQVVWHKRLELVVDAVGRLAAPRPPLVWVGDRSDAAYADSLIERAREQGVDLDLRVSVSDDELRQLLRGARALVHAARLEPFGYTPLEAAACAVPAVVVGEGGMRETVVDGVTGWVAAPDAAALAEALAACLESGDAGGEARRRGERGRDDVLSRWTLEAATDRLERHLDEIASGGGR